jgi:hypothetical protein
MLHQICMSHISNDNVRQGSKTIFGDDNIHSSLYMAHCHKTPSIVCSHIFVVLETYILEVV